jgi:hypothetical protein
MGRHSTDEEQAHSGLSKQSNKTLRERVHHLECMVEFLLSEVMNTGTEIQKSAIEKKISRLRYTEEAVKSHEKGVRAVQVTLPDGTRKRFVTTKETSMLDLLRLRDWNEGYRNSYRNPPPVGNTSERKSWRAMETAYFPAGGSRSQAIPELDRTREEVHKRKFLWEPSGIRPTSTRKLDSLRGFPPRRQESPCESTQFTTNSRNRSYGGDARQIKTEHPIPETVSSIDTDLLNIPPQLIPAFSMSTTSIASGQICSQTHSSAFGSEIGPPGRGQAWTEPVPQGHNNHGWSLQSNDAWQFQ